MQSSNVDELIEFKMIENQLNHQDSDFKTHMTPKNIDSGHKTMNNLDFKM